MPQFHSEAAEEAGRALDDFTAAYIMALYFTDTGEEDQPDTEAKLSPQALDRIKTECAEFQATAHALLCEAYQRETYGGAPQAGHDFWLTRNGHGAGFWDRAALTTDDLGARLTEACKAFGECWVALGDDGLIYLD